MKYFSSERIEFQPDERIILKVRKHWPILLKDTSSTIIAGMVPIIFGPILLSMFQVPPIYTGLVNFGFALWLLVVWMALAVLWTDYYLDLWIVTDRRIMNVDQRGLFDRNVSTWRMERVQEITVKTESFMQSFLNYGSIEIQTAGPSDEYATVRGIPNPEHVRDVIMEQVDAFAEKRSTTENEAAPAHLQEYAADNKVTPNDLSDTSL